MTCRLPGGLAEVVPALLAEPSGAEGGAPPGGNQDCLRQSAGVAQRASTAAFYAAWSSAGADTAWVSAVLLRRRAKLSGACLAVLFAHLCAE